jgi:fatty acid desaturase
MPYHQEHHAWPNVPFHKLPALHALVVASPHRHKSGCTPGGEDGYLWMHWVLLKQLIAGPVKGTFGENANPNPKTE